MEELKIMIGAIEDQKGFILEHIDDIYEMLDKEEIAEDYKEQYKNEIRECNQTIRGLNEKQNTLREAIKILDGEE